MNYEEICNLRILGDSTVGKTSILLRFTEDIFNSFCMTTVGIDYHFKDLTINNRNVRIKIYDGSACNSVLTNKQKDWNSQICAGEFEIFFACN